MMTAEIGAVRGRRAIAALIVALPVYRVYPEKDGIDHAEEATLAAAAEAAKTVLDAGDHIALDLVVRLVAHPQDGDELEFAQRLQQLSGPVMAKSLEDTACYRSVAVLAANEVGGHPPDVALSPEEFLAVSRRRLDTFPCTLVPTATHDTKRGADTRARLIAICEAQERWREAAAAWFAGNGRFRGAADDGTPAPDPVTEYLFYQSAAAAWPPLLRPDDESGLEAYAGRLTDYMIKAVREAKLQTKWTAPNEAFEGALREFVAASLTPGEGNDFLPSLHAFVEAIDASSRANSLAQVVLQAVSPGVPDIYQGSEAFDFSLVDPDNRRTPDFAALADGLPEAVDGLLETWRDGRLKQFVTHRALKLRREMPGLFTEGSVELLRAEGPAADHVVAMMRRQGQQAVVGVVLRSPARLPGAGEASQPAGALAGTSFVLPDGMGQAEDCVGDRVVDT